MITLPKNIKISSFLLLAVTVVASTDAAEITLKSRVTSSGHVVTLGDVATINGALPLVAALERLQLFPAPSKGKVRMMRRAELRELFELNGIDATAHKFHGATLTRIDPPRSRKQAAAAKRPPTRLDQPSASPGPSLAAPLAQVLVAKIDLKRGTRVEADHVELRPRASLAHLPPKEWLHDAEPAVGQEVVRSVPAGAPLEASWLRSPTLVRRGELVTVVAKAEGVEVKTTARAQDSGALGELISVQSLEGRRRFAARVSGLQQAEIFAGGSVVRDTPRLTREEKLPPLPPTEVRRARGSQAATTKQE